MAERERKRALFRLDTDRHLSWKDFGQGFMLFLLLPCKDPRVDVQAFSNQELAGNRGPHI